MKNALALYALTTTLLAGKPIPIPPGPVEFKMQSGWRIDYSKGVPAKPTYIGTGWLFNFPDAPGSVGYITQDVAGYVPVSTAATVSTIEAIITVDASADCIFDFHTNPDNTGNWPSSVRFYIESEWSNANYVRWWATGNNCVVLADGSFQYTVEIEPSKWSDTWGQNGASSELAIAGLSAAMAGPRRIGFTFGGGSFYGHGVNLLAGQASFHLGNIQLRTVSR